MRNLSRPYPTHEVTRGPWSTRAVVVLASGLTFDEAREVAREMREADPDHRYSVRSMSLEDQAAAIEAAHRVGPDGFTLDVSDLPPLPACACGRDMAVRLDDDGAREAFCAVCDTPLANSVRPPARLAA